MFDLSRNIAYNLQLLYVLAGDSQKAREISEQYMSI